MLAVQDVGLVQAVHLLEENEGENSVRTEASVIRREAFPEREEALGAHNAQQHLLGATKHTKFQNVIYTKYEPELKSASI